MPRPEFRRFFGEVPRPGKIHGSRRALTRRVAYKDAILSRISTPFPSSSSRCRHIYTSISLSQVPPAANN